MSGYTPVFDSVFHGTLCGRWPTLPVWLTILPMADKHGNIDMTYQAMSALTGWPIDLLKQAIGELCAPDPESRSDENDGRRLELIDPHRTWGWRVVNHAKYREKARLQSKSAAEVAAGRRRSSPVSAAHRPSDADANTDRKQEAASPDPVVGLQEPVWQRWEAYRREIKKPLRPASVYSARRALAAFGVDQGEVVEQSIANGWTGLFALKKPVDIQAQRKQAGVDAGWSRVKSHAESIGCPLKPYEVDTPDTYETRVKNWENMRPTKAVPVGELAARMRA